MDFAQKVFILPRSDSLLAVAGATEYSLPLVSQLLLAIEAYPKARDRRLPLPQLRTHILKIFKEMYSSIHSLPVGQKRPDDPDNYFLFGGFDWRTSEPIVWKLHYDKQLHEFRFDTVVKPGGKQFHFAGDCPEANQDATQKTAKLLREKAKSNLEIDMEPLVILSEICEDVKYTGIGGVLQVAKTYRHLNSQMFITRRGVTHDRRSYLAGRPLSDYEHSDLPICDLDQMCFRRA